MSEPNSPGTSNLNATVDCVDEEQLVMEPEISISTNKIPESARKKIPYMADPLLLPRVVEYINVLQEKSSSPGEHYIDVEEIVDELQRKYRDYRKKKRLPFKNSVQRALSIIMQNNGEPSDSGSSGGMSDEGSDALELMDQRPDSNSQIVNMYLQNKASSNKKVVMDGDKELIDISSSEEDNTERPSDVDTAVRLEAQRQERLRQAAALHAQARRANKTTETPPNISHQQQEVANSQEKNMPNILRKRKSPPEVEIPGGPQRPSNPSKKRKFSSVPLGAGGPTFKDIGGNENCLKEVCQLLVHIKHPEVYEQLGVSPPRGFLLHGPPGCGKSLLAQAIAGELQIPLIKVAATELVAGISGESEERIRELFEQATASAPCVLFLDEIDAIAPHRATAQREMERRIVAQLLSSMDELALSGVSVLVVGATNRPDALDPALRRAGRFDREVSLGIPDEKARESILRVLCAKLRLASGLDLVALSKLTPGFVGADLAALTREAAMAAVNRVLGVLKNKWNDKKEIVKSPSKEAPATTTEKPTASTEKPTASTEKPTATTEKPTATTEKPAETSEENGEMEVVMQEPEVSSNQENGTEEVPEVPKVAQQLTLEELMEWLKEKPPLSAAQLAELSIEQRDFELALKSVQPSAKREGFATVPDVTWEDVGSLQDVREELKMTILAPVKFAEQFAALGLTSPAGVLLCGPPGCGKTLLAKAVANEAGINFISVKGPELLNMYVGESERAVRQCFQRAKNSAPCVIFFDELDSLCPKRSDSGEGGASMRVVNQMLTEMDGIEGRRGVFLMAATNRPDIVDPAVLRPGRLDKILYIGLPANEDRKDILRALTKGGTAPQLAADVNMSTLADQSEGYTGADLAAMVREASLQALRGVMAGEAGATLTVHMKHFSQAIAKIRPSVADKDKKRYETLRVLYGPKKQDDSSNGSLV